MKKLFAVLAVLAMVSSLVMAEDAPAAGKATEMTLTGKVLKHEKKGDEGVVKYGLATKDHGKVMLPKSETVKMEEYVDQYVELVVKAIVKEKEGKKKVKVEEIVSAKKVEVPAEAPKEETPKAEEPAKPAEPAK